MISYWRKWAWSHVKSWTNMKRNLSKCPKCSVWEVVLTLFLFENDWFLKMSKMGEKWRFLSFCYPASDRSRRADSMWCGHLSRRRLHPIFWSFLVLSIFDQSLKFCWIHYFFQLWSSPASTTILGFPIIRRSTDRRSSIFENFELRLILLRLICPSLKLMCLQP